MATGGSGQLPKPLTTRPTSKSSSCSLCRAVSTDARGHLNAAGQAGGRSEQQRQLRSRHAGPLGHVVAHLLRRSVTRLEAQHRALRALVDVEIVVEVLSPDQRPARSTGHREVTFRVQAPAGVLRREAGQRRTIGDDRQPGKPAALQHERCEGHPTQASHADLRELSSRFETAGNAAAAVDQPRAAWQRGHRDAQGVGLVGEAVSELLCAIVERERHDGGA